MHALIRTNTSGSWGARRTDLGLLEDGECESMECELKEEIRRKISRIHVEPESGSEEGVRGLGQARYGKILNTAYIHSFLMILLNRKNKSVFIFRAKETTGVIINKDVRLRLTSDTFATSFRFVWIEKQKDVTISEKCIAYLNDHSIHLMTISGMGLARRGVIFRIFLKEFWLYYEQRGCFF